MSNEEQNNEETKDLEKDAVSSEETTEQTDSGSENDGATENGGEQEEPLSEIEQLRLDNTDLKDKYLRIFAEFDNYKKRTAKERIDTIAMAGQKVIRDMLPILDDFERGFKAKGTDRFRMNIDEGEGLIYAKFKKTLENKGLKQMEVQGEVFNAELHEAIAELPAEKPEDKGKIIDVIEPGYYLNDKILRYAKVVVGK